MAKPPRFLFPIYGQKLVIFVIGASVDLSAHIVFVTDPQRLNCFKGDYVAIRENLRDFDRNIASVDSVNDFWNFFSDKLTSEMHKHIPVSKSRESFRKPWMTKSTAAAIDKKRRAWIKYQNVKVILNYNLYKHQRDTTTSIVRNAKYEYEKSIALNIKADNKSFWKYVKSKSKTKEGISDLMNENDSLSNSDKEKADILNRFY